MKKNLILFSIFLFLPFYIYSETYELTGNQSELLKFNGLNEEEIYIKIKNKVKK